MSDDDLTIADAVIEAMPAHDSLIAWYWKYPNFRAGLKFSNHGRFHPIGALSTSHSPKKPGDEVLGFFVYDKDLAKFKQDYIVNVGGTHTEYVLYTKRPDKKYDKQVQPINTFFADYDSKEDFEQGRGYRFDHHLSLKRIEAMATGDRSYFVTMAHSAIKRANGPIASPTQDEIRDALEKIRAEKRRIQTEKDAKSSS